MAAAPFRTFATVSAKSGRSPNVGLTQVACKRARAERSQNCFLLFSVSTMAASAVLFLFNAIEKVLPRASPTQEFSHRLDYRVQLVDEHAHVLAVVDGRHDEMHAAVC